MPPERAHVMLEEALGGAFEVVEGTPEQLTVRGTNGARLLSRHAMRMRMLFPLGGETFAGLVVPAGAHADAADADTSQRPRRPVERTHRVFVAARVTPDGRFIAVCRIERVETASGGRPFLQKMLTGLAQDAARKLAGEIGVAADACGLGTRETLDWTMGTLADALRVP